MTYQPGCPYCNDSSCPACEGVQAQIFRRKVGQDEAAFQRSVAEQFIVRCWPQLDGQLLMPRDKEHLIETVTGAIDYGRQVYQAKSEGLRESAVRQDKCKRFEKLELEEGGR